jgi:ABC-type nitrate/sulfonate/bicarbonate transport system substrate-binding protein
MLSRSDYVMRLVKELAEVLARALKLRAENPEQAKQVLIDACGELLGVEHRVLNMLDAQSAASLLGENVRIAVYAQLVDAMGDSARAAELKNARL